MCRRIQAATTAAKNPFEIERQQLGVGTADRMAGKVVRTEESENRNVPQDSSRHHGGEESVRN